MRQLLIHVPDGQGRHVLQIASQHQGTHLSVSRAQDGHGAPIDAVTVHLSNARVGPFLADLDPIPDLHLFMTPQGVLTLEPPASEAHNQVTDVTFRSPIEVYIGGLQSIGSWLGFLSYAAVGGVVVWLGLITNTSFLLVAAMLIAPFASPAMNAAIATARGDATLLGRSVGRYVAALATSVLVAGLLSLAFRQEIATQQMASTANISSATVLLPLAAGAAGALNLIQSQRSSLVSGAATGMLVAASLAPPAGLIGMAAAIARWDMLQSGAFLLGLQLLGINLAGAIVFRLAGLAPEGPRFSRGRGWLTWLAGLATVLGLIAMLWWQFGTSQPTLQRATIEERARAVVGQVVAEEPAARLVEATVRFTRADIPTQNTLLVEVYAQRTPEATTSDDELRRLLTELIQQALDAQGYYVTPLVDVTVLAPPSSPTD